MPTEKQHKGREIAKEIYVGVAGWVWVVACLASLYFLVRAIVFDDPWWPAVTSVAMAWMLYEVSLYCLAERKNLLSIGKSKMRLTMLKDKWGERKAPTPETAISAGDGATPENAIRIHAANSVEGISKQYAILEAMFGTQNLDWKFIERSLIHADDGRKLDRFIISARDKMKESYFDINEIYFDITEWVSKNTSREVQMMFEKIIAQNDKPFTITFQKEELVTLQIGMIHLTEAELNLLGLSPTDHDSMLDPLINALKPWYGKEYVNLPERIDVTTPISVWMKIMGLLASWQPASLLQEEELANLKATIGGGMLAERNTSQSS
jgi:hypothetical protein